MLDVNPEWLVNSATLTKYKRETDEWGNKSIEATIKIDNVRVDLAPTYVGSGNGASLVANGAIFIYSKYSTPFPDFDLEKDLNSVVTINGLTKEYLVKTITPIYDVEDNQLFGYEMDIL